MPIHISNGLPRDNADGRYVLKAGDTMTGKLVIAPVTGTTSIQANKDIIIVAGQRMVFDGS